MCFIQLIIKTKYIKSYNWIVQLANYHLINILYFLIKFYFKNEFRYKEQTSGYQ